MKFFWQIALWSGFAIGFNPVMQAQALENPKIKHILVIGVDGMSPDGIRNAPTPAMDQLMQGGSYTFHARAVLPSSSSPNWASMIMGAGPEQHGITSNDWEKDRYTLPFSAENEFHHFPTIFYLMYKHDPKSEIGAIYHWEGFGRLVEPEVLDFNRHEETEDLTITTACTYLREKRPDFCFIHLDHVDHAGHTFGHGSPEYYASVAKADSLISQVIRVLEQTGLRDSTLILLTADHGGTGKVHGGESLAEMEIPFILNGPGVKVGYVIESPVNTTDNAATLAWAWGLEIPYVWIGKPVKEAFEGFLAPQQSYTRGKELKTKE